MAQKLCFDTGVEEYEINGSGILRFNPTDPNLYKRFYEVTEDLQAIEREYDEKVSALASEVQETDQKGFSKGGEILSLMRSMDAKIKQRLSFVFGEENDFDKLLGGVNLLAIGKNGERVVTNVITALTPIMEAGIRKQAKDEAAAAVAQAKLNRAQRRAVK